MKSTSADMLEEFKICDVDIHNFDLLYNHKFSTFFGICFDSFDRWFRHGDVKYCNNKPQETYLIWWRIWEFV
jgi:hypothetical protein